MSSSPSSQTTQSQQTRIRTQEIITRETRTQETRTSSVEPTSFSSTTIAASVFSTTRTIVQTGTMETSTTRSTPPATSAPPPASSSSSEPPSRTTTASPQTTQTAAPSSSSDARPSPTSVSITSSSTSPTPTSTTAITSTDSSSSSTSPASSTSPISSSSTSALSSTSSTSTLTSTSAPGETPGPIVVPPPGCVSLDGSKTCWSFNGYAVGADVNPWLKTTFQNESLSHPQLQNVADFDKMMLQILPYIGPRFYQVSFGCSMYGGDRYTATILCANVVHYFNGPNANARSKCGDSFAAVCQNTFDDWYNSLTDSAKNETICPMSPADRQFVLGEINNKRAEYKNTEYLNGTGQTCIAGDQNEPDKCGWFTHDIACEKNCSSPTLDCVQATDNSSGVSIAGIIGGVVGAVVGLALLVLFILAFRRRRRRHRKMESIGASVYPAGTDAMTAVHIGNPATGAIVGGASGVGGVGGAVGASLAAAPVFSQNRGTEAIAYGDYLQPQRNDEVTIMRGDRVAIHEAYDDGWGFVQNFSSGEQGMAPLVIFDPNYMMSMSQPASSTASDYASGATSRSAPEYLSTSMPLRTSSNTISY